MAHQFVKGFFSNNEPAWHGLGKVLPEGVWPGREEAQILAGPNTPDAHRRTAYGIWQAGLEYLQHGRKTRRSYSKLNRSILIEEKTATNLHKLVLSIVK